MNRTRPLWHSLTIIAGILLNGCDRGDPKLSEGPVAPKNVAAPVPPVRDEIPADQLAPVIDAHYRGVGAMERYEYAEAARAFGDVHARAPGWTIGTINLAIALLNQGGEAVEKAKKGDQEVEAESTLNIEKSCKLLDEVIAQHPDQPYALFSRGIILSSQGELAAAHRDFARVAAIDPHDAHTWLEYGLTLVEPGRDNMPAQRGQAPELIAAYTKALEANPYLVPAMYKLMLSYGLAKDPQGQKKMQDLWTRLNPKTNPSATGEIGAIVYGEMGKYAQIISPFSRPEVATPQPPPRFGPAAMIDVSLAPGDRWARREDYVPKQAAIGRARSRFGAGVATFDVDNDGRLDLYLTAAIVGPQGLRDALLVNVGPGKFVDRTADYGLPLDRAGLGVAAGDFDADRHIDLYLTGVADNRLLRQEQGRFVDVTRAAGVVVADAITLTARWFDIDQDGDLDLYIVNHAPAADLDQVFMPGKGGSGLANVAFRNDGKPEPLPMTPVNNLAPVAVATRSIPAEKGLSIAFSTAWATPDILTGQASRHTAFTALDIDDDRDIDFVLTADDQPPTLILNERAGRFRTAPLGGWSVVGNLSGLLAADIDRDGHTDLVATDASGRAFAWRNETTRRDSALDVTGRSFPINARSWRSAVATDLDLDTRIDLVGLSAPEAPGGFEWARNEDNRLDNRAVPLGPIGPEFRESVGFAVANLVGDPLLDLVLWRDGEAPRIAPNLGNGQHWLAIDLAGRWKNDFDLMRTNPAGLGTRLALEGQGLYVPLDYTGLDASTAQSVGPVVVGMGKSAMAPLLRVRWPDGVMQAELNVSADKTLNLVEFNRKTGSCPILFTWNGERFVCVGDFAGAAGLGFLEAPNVYHPPDRDEAMSVTTGQLRDSAGILHLSVVEPMDEVAYLDRLSLDVIDRPNNVTVAPDERFAFGAPRPTRSLRAWDRTIAPRSAQDHRGADLLDPITSADRRTADRFGRINGWVGYTEDHTLTIDFGDVSGQLGSNDEPILCLTGWVEYPYSQTNYAAATAGIISKPPTLEQRLVSGEWRVIDPQMGHPGGLPRMMTYSLAGKLSPGADCVLRMSTNMECYWDQAYIAIRTPDAERAVRTFTLPVSTANLRDRGYLRESSPDGLKPILPDYQQVDPVPFARFRGELTRHGDVAPLLQADDDRLCVMGPGDEVQLEFDGSRLPELPSGWTRSYVFRSVAYCKDADPFTATSDTVGPLPWREMPPFPFPAGTERPSDPAYRAYLQEYQTRPAGIAESSQPGMSLPTRPGPQVRRAPGRRGLGGCGL